MEELFAGYVLDITRQHSATTVIEIHHPFGDCCTMPPFAERSATFERIVREAYPGLDVVIENRASSVYSSGGLVFRTAREIAALYNLLTGRSLLLGVALDFPQPLTAERITHYSLSRPEGRFKL